VPRNYGEKGRNSWNIRENVEVLHEYQVLIPKIKESDWHQRFAQNILEQQRLIKTQIKRQQERKCAANGSAATVERKKQERG